LIPIYFVLYRSHFGSRKFQCVHRYKPCFSISTTTMPKGHKYISVADAEKKEKENKDNDAKMQAAIDAAVAAAVAAMAAPAAPAAAPAAVANVVAEEWSKYCNHPNCWCEGKNLAVRWVRNLARCEAFEQSCKNSTLVAEEWSKYCNHPNCWCEGKNLAVKWVRNLARCEAFEQWCKQA